MTDIRALLSRLSELEDGEPVVTLALDTRWRDEHQRARVRLFVRDRLRDARELFGKVDDEERAIAPTLDRIERWTDEVVNRDRHESAAGIILFASEARDLFVECVLPVSPTPAMWIDRRPLLWPLARELDRTRPLIVVDVGVTGAHIAQWDFGTVEEKTIEREVPGRHQMGGWSQARYQRHIRDHIHRAWKECATLLQQLVIESPDARVVLLGQDMSLRRFMRELPRPVSERVVAMRPSPPESLKRIEVGLEVLEEERVAHEFSTVHNILRQGLSDRSGTVGLEQTLMAVNERQVRELAISEGFNRQGVKCRSCRGLWTKGSPGCVFCGQEVKLVPLRDEILTRAVRQEADVTVVQQGGPLDAYHGLGALLRRSQTDVREPFATQVDDQEAVQPPR